MREAKEIVDVKRKKDNEQLKAQGKEDLPADTLHMEVQMKCAELFETIEEKKKHFVRVEKAYERQKRAQFEVEKTKTQILKEDAEEWDAGREKRTQNWRDFGAKKTKTIKK